MANVLFAWEVGQNYGHLHGFLPVALELRARGHTVHFALHDLVRAQGVLGPHGFAYSQAPTWRAALRHPRRLHSYADLLCHQGYLDAAGVEGLVRAWHWTFRAAAADLVVADFSPTAQWAARSAGLPSLAFGTGYANPPLTTPLPDVRWWRPTPPAQRAALEARLLQSVNAAAAALGDAAFASLADLLHADERWLTTFAELDHYPDRDEACEYGAPRFSLDEGDPAQWPAGDGPRVFAYLQPDAADFDAVCAALAKLDTPCLVHVRGIPARERARRETARLVFAPQPVRMREARDGCDLCVCHAGHGTVAAMLLAGKPLLMIPQHLEQEITARNVVRLGAGLAAVPGERRPNYPRLARQLLDRPGFTDAARAFAQRHAAHAEGTDTTTVADRCEALLPR